MSKLLVFLLASVLLISSCAKSQVVPVSDSSGATSLEENIPTATVNTIAATPEPDSWENTGSATLQIWDDR